MAHEFFHQDMKLFVDHRVDWRRYFHLLRGTGVDAFNEAASASACGGCHPFDRRAGMPGRRKERPVLLSRGSARYDRWDHERNVEGLLPS